MHAGKEHSKMTKTSRPRRADAACFDYEVRISGLGGKNDAAAALDVLKQMAQHAIRLGPPSLGSNWVEEHRLILARLRRTHAGAGSINVTGLAYAEAKELSDDFRELMKLLSDVARGTESAAIFLNGHAVPPRRIPAVGARSRKPLAAAA
jgi:hypothetical protein